MARIAIDAACWANRRGYGRYMRELLAAVWAIDRENEYLFLADRATAAEAHFPKHVATRVVALRDQPTQAAGAGTARRPADLIALGHAARREPLDILFFPSVYTYFPYFGNARTVLVIHDAIPERHPAMVFPDLKSRLFWKAKLALALREASMVVTVSEHARRELAEVFDLDAATIPVVSEAPSRVFVDAFGTAKNADLLKRRGVDPTAPYFLYVGGFGPHKNLERLLEVYHALHQKQGAATPNLVLIGDFEKDSFLSNFGQLSKWVAERGLGKKIAFPGFLPDEELAQLYAHCLALILPSLREGFGLPAVEAAATGAPVIATRHSPLPEVLAGGGLFIEPTDSQCLYGAMETMMTAPDRRAEWAATARARAAALSWERSAQELLACFRRVAAR